jgi:hypothetical protein
LTALIGPDEWKELNGVDLPELGGVGSVRCAAVKSSGERCRNVAIEGCDLCRFHGGTTVSVQEQTRRRIDAVRSTLFDKLVDAAERAVDVYIGVMDDEKAGPKYRMQAADRVLELMGFRDQVIQVEVKQTQEVSDLDRELLTVLQSVSEQRIIQAIEAVSTEVPSEPVREPSRA